MCGVRLTECACPGSNEKRRAARAGKEYGAPALIDESVQAKKLIAAPRSIRCFKTPRPDFFSEHMQRGAARIQGFGLAVESKHRHRVQEEKTKKMPITIALRMIAEGIVRKGSFALQPSEAALSKPTKLKSASTRPSRTWSAVTP